MYTILSASKDAYITNKILRNSFRVEDSNVGQAATLDLFKLYNESVSGSNDVPRYEYSRALIKFDLTDLKSMHTSGELDINDPSFIVKMKLFDVYGGQTTPSNFKLIAFPLSKSFDEGLGRDIVNFDDLGSVNFLTASAPNPSSTIKSHATLTVSDGDDNSVSNLPAEKASITITSTDGTSKKYVIVDDHNTTVATGDVLVSDSDTGSSTAGSSLAGGIAVAINLAGSVSTQNNLLVQLKSAIENANGHDGKITVSAVPSADDGSQSITLTQLIAGYDGNKDIDNNLIKVTSTNFTGGVGGAIRWHQPGAFKSGSLGSTNIDVIVSGSLIGPNGTNYVNLTREQLFNTGEENFEVDMTDIISGTITNQIPDYGFLIAYSASYEKNTKSYFVKRFASRHVSKESLRPQLIVKYDDSIIDNHNNFVFNVSGSLFLHNYHRGVLSNILSGAAASQITGDDCIKLILKSGSFEKGITGSQHKIGSVGQTGIYSASFAISEYVTTGMLTEVVNAGSASFTKIWGSLDDTIGFYTGSLVITSPFRSEASNVQKRLLVSVTNLRREYRQVDKAKLRVFIEDKDRGIRFSKTPMETESQVFNKMYYRIVDSQSKEEIIPLDTDNENNATRLSSDSKGMFFNLRMKSLPKNRSYKIEFLIKDFENDILVKDASSVFSVK